MSDLISRSKLLNVMKNSLPFRMNANGMERAVEMVKNADAIDAEPVRHGRWTGFDPYIGSTECSECGYKIVFAGAKYKYCPNCGAKMDLEEENEP